MPYQDLLELNEVAELLLGENANRIANSIGKLFGGDDKKKGG